MKISITLFYLLSFSITFGQSGSWIWMNGDNSTSGTAVWGTQGVFAAGNTPPPTYESAEWTDKDGGFWLFGGLTPSGEMNMIWKYDKSLNQWAWINGSSNCCVQGVYGVQTIPDPANHPGGRAWGAIAWTDTSGNFWLFGGYGYDALGTTGNLDDLWKYDPLTNEWTWMHGSEFQGANPAYGTQGVADVNNTPGNRCEFAASWTDCSTNTLWLFGGWNFTGVYNDVWKYDIASNAWTWVKGSNFQGASGVYGTKGVPAPTNTPPARRAYCKWKDVYGNFWIFGGLDYNNNVYNDLWKYDPLTNEWTWVSGPNISNDNGSYQSYCDPDTLELPKSRFENRACWTDADGKLWLFGGMNGALDPTNDTWYFEPSTNEWTWVFGLGNSTQSTVWGTQGVANASNHPGPRAGSVSWVDDSSNLWLFGGKNFNGTFSYNDLWKFIPDTSCGASENIGYPTNCGTLSSPVAFNASDTTLCEKFCLDFFDQSINSPTAWLWLFDGGIPSSSTLQNPSNICYQNPGTYDVTLITTSTAGNDTLLLTDYITVYPTPPFPTITQSGYTLTSSAASSYQWQFNSVDIPGATNQSYDAQQTGYYSVIITDQNGCVSAGTVYILIEGIEDIISDAGVLVYPNPTDGVFTIEIFNSIAGSNNDPVSVKLVNALGQIIWSSIESKTVSNSGWSAGNHSIKRIIDLSTATPGVYFIEIKGLNLFANQKLLLTR